LTKPSVPVSLNFSRRIKLVLSEVVQRKSFSFTVWVSEPPVIAPSITRQRFVSPSHPASVAPSNSDTVLAGGGGTAAWVNETAQMQMTRHASFTMFVVS